MTSDAYEKRTAGPIHLRIPPDDNIQRLICNECGFINYINPKIIVGAVCTWGNKFLLCKRAIKPRVGFWTMPAGFMEEGETSMEGAQREAWEEAGAVWTQDRANKIWKNILDNFEAPPIDETINEQLKDFVSKRISEGGAPTDF